jgi:hypothetical protein
LQRLKKSAGISDEETFMKKILEYAGTPSNLSGAVATIAAVGVTATLNMNPILTIVAAVTSYAGGALLFSQAKHLITVGDEVKEEERVSTSIYTLRQQIQEHQSALPTQVITEVKSLLDTLEDLLPRWETMDSFVEQKHTINSIVTDYLPNMLNAYLQLPKSYLVRTKKEAEENILNQVGIMQNAVNEIQDGVYKGVERTIQEQNQFLETKFTKNTGLLL